MTTTPLPLPKLPPQEVCGPYSSWPRVQKPRRRGTAVVAGFGAAGLIVFTHCLVPLLA